MAKRGRGARGAGDRRDRLVRRRHDRHRRADVRRPSRWPTSRCSSARGLLRADGAGVRRRSPRCVGRSLVRGLIGAAARPADRVRRHRPADRPVAADVRRRPARQRHRHRASSPSGCSRSARRCTWRQAAQADEELPDQGRASSRSRSRGAARWLSRADLRRSWKPWLRGTAHRLPVRRAARRRRRDADVPVLLDREAARQRPRGVRRGRDRGRRRARGRQQRRPSRACSCRC